VGVTVIIATHEIDASMAEGKVLHLDHGQLVSGLPA